MDVEEDNASSLMTTNNDTEQLFYKSRKPTDQSMFVVLVVFSFILVVGSIYCFCIGDITKIFNGFDDVKNSDLVMTIFHDLIVARATIIESTFIAVAFSILIVFLFRSLVGLFVWTVIIAGVLAAFGLSVVLWYAYNDTQNSVCLVLALIISTGTMILTLILIAIRKKIDLVIQLLKEAGKILYELPFLFVLPLITIVAWAIISFMYIFLNLYFHTINVPASTNNAPNTFSVFMQYWTMIAFYWFTQFFLGCQQMVIGGAVSAWFFTRNKSELNSPIMNSFRIIVRYHLGTVLLGSLLIALIKVLKICFKLVFKNRLFKMLWCCFSCCCCDCFKHFDCLTIIKVWLQYICKYAYIETAIHGYDFIDSGKRAIQLLAENVQEIIALKVISKLMLLLAKMIVMVCTVGLGYLILKGYDDHIADPDLVLVLVCIAAVAFAISHGIMTVYETVLDALFICYCEDCEQNDGINRPFYMSVVFMEFMESSKKHYSQNRVITTINN